MSARPIRALLALLAVFALIAAACGGGDDGGDDTAEVGDDDTTTTSSTEAPATGDDDGGGDDDDDTAPPPEEIELFDSYEGVTAESIKVGVLTADLDLLREQGFVDINNGDVELIWEVLIDDFNAKGGVLGRSLEIVFEKYHPVFADDAERACRLLTEDENVFAVLGGPAGPSRDATLCFVDLNETIMIGGTHTPDFLEASKAPWVTLGAASERRYRDLLGLYDDAGLLSGNLGVFDDSTERVQLTESVLLPALDDLGYDVTTHVTSTVEGDEVELGVQAEVFAERLDQDGIDTLLIVQSQIAFGVALMRENGFDGTILTVDVGFTLNTLGGFDERDPSTYDGAYGPIGLTSDEVWALDSTQECVSILTDAQPDIAVLPSAEVPDGEPNWLGGLLGPCQLLELFRLIGEGAGADLNPDTFLEAAQGLGSFELPGAPNNSLAEGKLDANDDLRIGIFDSTVGATGRVVPLE